MISTEAYFENIKAELQLELNNAKRTIYVALAWFTDKDLLQTLVQKAKDNVNVQLLVFNDEINFGDYGLPFENLSNAGGKFFIKEENLMHNKFCIIDERIIITGSYNWTRKASTTNNENIVIIKDDFELAKSYTKEFNKLIGANNIDTEELIGKVIKRLKIIQSLIELKDVEDIELQILRLQKDDINARTADIINDLKTKQYYKATENINHFIAQYSNIVIYTDPEIPALQLEISLLEYQIIALDYELAEVEKQIADFNHQMHVRLGNLMRQVFKAKTLYYSNHKQESKEAEEAHKKAKEQQEQFAQDSEEEEAKEYYEIAEKERVEIKAAFRAASMLCHPDKFENEMPEIKKQAEELFKELNAANEKNDIKTVKHIYEQLKAGILNIEIKKQAKKELLLLQYENLTNKCLAKSNILANFNESEVIKLLKKYTNMEDYFIELEQQLKQELTHWQNKNTL